jgi:hypothetical protein
MKLRENSWSTLGLSFGQIPRVMRLGPVWAYSYRGFTVEPWRGGRILPAYCCYVPAVLERPWIFPSVVLGCCIEPYVLEGSPGCGFPLSG